MHAEYAIPPDLLLDCGFANCGVSHSPVSLLDLARLDSVPRVMSAWPAIPASLIRIQGRLRSWGVFVRMV